MPVRHELDESQELNYPAIMRAIAATNYDGYVGQEYTTKGDALMGFATGLRCLQGVNYRGIW